MKQIIAFLCLTLIIGINGLLLANHTLHLFEQANKYYEEKKYTEAVNQYEQILKNGYESWELYYNLGNAYYKTDNIGKAILNYERAKKLNNENEDVEFNLKIANMKVVDKIKIPPNFILFHIMSSIKNYFTLNTLSLFLIISYIIGISLLNVRIITRKQGIQRLMLGLSIPILIFFLFFSIVFCARLYEIKNIKYAIILADELNVMSSPELNATELFTLHQGVKIKVEKKNGDWRQIRLIDGKVGWVKKDGFEIL